MKQKRITPLTYWLGIIAFGLVTGISIQFVSAWTEPGSLPPGGNVAGPLNTGAAKQTKAGQIDFVGGGAFGTGGIGIGAHTLNSHFSDWLYVGDQNGNIFGNRGLAAGNIYAAGNLYSRGVLLDANGNGWPDRADSVSGGGVGGSGVANSLSKWTTVTTLGNSQIYDDGNNVAIGHFSPTSKLHVRGDVFSSAGGAYNQGGLRMQNHTLSSNSNGWLYLGGVNYDVYGGKGLATGQLWTDSGTFLGMGAGGNVGIGTASPTTKLDVNGSAVVRGSFSVAGDTSLSTLTVNSCPCGTCWSIQKSTIAGCEVRHMCTPSGLQRTESIGDCSGAS